MTSSNRSRSTRVQAHQGPFVANPLLLEKAGFWVGERGQVAVQFVLRQLEGLSTEEVARIAGISSDNVKARFHRAKVALRKAIDSRIGCQAKELFDFHLSRCDRVVANVLGRVSKERRSA